MEFRVDGRKKTKRQRRRRRRRKFGWGEIYTGSPVPPVDDLGKN
jgi:hypothetical protein